MKDADKASTLTHPYAASMDRVLSILEANSLGLTQEEAANRLQSHGRKVIFLLISAGAADGAIRYCCRSASAHRCHVYPLDQRCAAYTAGQLPTFFDPDLKQIKDPYK